MSTDGNDSGKGGRLTCIETEEEFNKLSIEVLNVLIPSMCWKCACTFLMHKIKDIICENAGHTTSEENKIEFLDFLENVKHSFTHGELKDDEIV